MKKQVVENSKVRDILDCIYFQGLDSVEVDFNQAETAIRSAVIDEVLGKLPERIDYGRIMRNNEDMAYKDGFNDLYDQVTQTLEEMKDGS